MNQIKILICHRAREVILNPASQIPTHFPQSCYINPGYNIIRKCYRLEYAYHYLFLSLKAQQGTITVKGHPEKSMGLWGWMRQLNPASCNGPGGEVIQLKCGICEDQIQNPHYFFSTANRRQGFPSPPPPMESGWEFQLYCAWPGLRTQTPQRPRRAASVVLPVELPDSGKFQMQDLLASCSVLWKTKPDKVQRNDYYDCLSFANNFFL